MKKMYEQPELEIINFSVENVMNGSIPDPTDNDELPLIPG